MSHWWEIAAADEPPVVRPRAVAYYRHSAQDRQENSIPIQRDQVREWADKNGVEIIKEFEDAGKSGLDAEGRPAFNEMMDQWIKQKRDFVYVLCLDVSRWGLPGYRPFRAVQRRMQKERQAGHLHDDRQAAGE